jgi:hypothetical protein
MFGNYKLISETRNTDERVEVDEYQYILQMMMEIL